MADAPEEDTQMADARFKTPPPKPRQAPAVSHKKPGTPADQPKPKQRKTETAAGAETVTPSADATPAEESKESEPTVEPAVEPAAQEPDAVAKQLDARFAKEAADENVKTGNKPKTYNVFGYMLTGGDMVLLALTVLIWLPLFLFHVLTDWSCTDENLGMFKDIRKVVCILIVREILAPYLYPPNFFASLNNFGDYIIGSYSMVFSWSNLMFAQENSGLLLIIGLVLVVSLGCWVIKGGYSSLEKRAPLVFGFCEKLLPSIWSKFVGFFVTAGHIGCGLCESLGDELSARGYMSAATWTKVKEWGSWAKDKVKGAVTEADGQEGA